MEQWEIDLRAKLEKELEDGYYQISSGDSVLGTGKGGYINFMVSLDKAARKIISMPIKEESSSEGMDDFREMMKLIRKKI